MMMTFGFTGDFAKMKRVNDDSHVITWHVNPCAMTLAEHGSFMQCSLKRTTVALLCINFKI